MKWYIKYFWIKFKIFLLTPCVWFEKKWNAYKKMRLDAYVKYNCAADLMSKNKIK